jgi:ABC-type transport system substrate-binding protein
MTLDRTGMLEAAYNLSGVQELGIPFKSIWNTSVPAFERPFWLDPTGEFQHKPSDPQMSAEGQETFALDIQGAKQRLDAAGYPDGFDTKLNTTPARYGDAFNIMSELILVFAKEAGINLELNPQDYSSDYIINTARGNFDGLAHIPRGVGGTGQYEIYYRPGAIRNNSILSTLKTDDFLNGLVDTMTQSRDFEEQRLAVLEAQEYESAKHYFTPSQLGAAGVFVAFQPNMGGVQDFVVRTTANNAAVEYAFYSKSV